jgi:hypothetical protein
MAKGLASIELASAASQDVLCSVLNVNDCAETTDCVDLLVTVCDDYPWFAEKWSDEYLGDRRIQFNTVPSEERDSLSGFGRIIEHIRQISKYSARADFLVWNARQWGWHGSLIEQVRHYNDH